MATEINMQEPREIDADLFEMLDEGLRAVFEKNVRRDGYNGSNEQTHGLAAAQAAQALMALHRDFRPKN